MIFALEFSTFIGRFHPLLVHLPIGFIILAILLEWWERFTKKGKSNLIPTAWFLGGLSAVAAAVCGWFLGETGLYEEDRLFLHKWLGIALGPISFIGWWIKKGGNRYSPVLQSGFNILFIVLLSVVGHQGANLTHGEVYLTEFAPRPIKKLLGQNEEIALKAISNNPDSVVVYKELIAPIFEAKCVACHNNEIKRGNLNMSHPDSLLAGGNGGTVLMAGNLLESELFRRITLPPSNVKFMPPTSNVLTYDEIKTLEWWIKKGAGFTETVIDLGTTDDMASVLKRRFGLDATIRPWYERVQIPPLDSLKIAELRQLGFNVRALGTSNPLLDVSYLGRDLTAEKITALQSAGLHITWLSLGDTNIENDWLKDISGFTNLTRLELDQTGVSDAGIAHLTALVNLEALNLYGSAVTDDVLPLLQELSHLKRVYLSGTRVSPEKAEVFDKEAIDLTIIIAKNGNE